MSKILFITTDEQRFDALGCNGGTIAKTPRLDSLATSGLNYHRAYVNNVVCMPSRATMVTGQYPSTHGVIANGISLPLEAPCIADTFKNDAGFSTALIGKSHLQPVAGADADVPDRPLLAHFDKLLQSVSRRQRIYMRTSSIVDVARLVVSVNEHRIEVIRPARPQTVLHAAPRRRRGMIRSHLVLDVTADLRLQVNLLAPFTRKRLAPAFLDLSGVGVEEVHSQLQRPLYSGNRLILCL